MILTLSPCGSIRTLEFMQWLGVSFPRWARRKLSDMTAARGPDTNSMDLSAGIVEWLLQAQGRRSDAETLVEELAARLEGAGVFVSRCATSLLTLHPEVYVRNIRWRRGEVPRVSLRLHDLRKSPDYLGSPVKAIHDGSGPIRRRLSGPSAQMDFVSLRDLAAQGDTDYVIFPLPYTDGRLSFISWNTSAPDGFTEAQLHILQSVIPALALRLELESAYYATRSLLEVYLGRSAAAHVLAGGVQRGGGERIEAALWSCDFRDFTGLNEREPVDEVLRVLDRFFECTAGVVEEAGGEVLKFIGDAVMAVFPAATAGPTAACRAALAVAERAVALVEGFSNERVLKGRAPVAVGIGMHWGEVIFGNIGARNRLDFTVIGRAVNETSRIEGMCKALSAPIVMSREFASRVDASSVSLGMHRLKGVSALMELFTPSRVTAPLLGS